MHCIRSDRAVKSLAKLYETLPRWAAVEAMLKRLAAAAVLANKYVLPAKTKGEELPEDKRK